MATLTRKERVALSRAAALARWTGRNPMERATIRGIREAVASGRLPGEFTPAQVNRVLGVTWAGTFLPKHRVDNPGGNSELFVRIRAGVYRLRWEL
jgi:hypothetical protein